MWHGRMVLHDMMTMDVGDDVHHDNDVLCSWMVVKMMMVMMMLMMLLMLMMLIALKVIFVHVDLHSICMI